MGQQCFFTTHSMHLGQWQYLLALSDIQKHDKPDYNKGPGIKGAWLCVWKMPECVFSVNESIKVIATIFRSSPDACKKSQIKAKEGLISLSLVNPPWFFYSLHFNFVKRPGWRSQASGSMFLKRGMRFSAWIMHTDQITHIQGFVCPLG